MTRTRRHWKVAAGLALILFVPALSQAGPYLGEWGIWWHPPRDCSRGGYSPLHYWIPSAYRVDSFVHPVSMDQFPPGPSCVGPKYEYHRYRCPSAPPMPTSPYADPEAYYGRPVAPRYQAP